MKNFKGFKKGYTPWNKGKSSAMKGKTHTIKDRLKMSISHTGVSLSEEHKEKITQGTNVLSYKLSRSRENHPGWKGGRVKNKDGYIVIKIYENDFVTKGEYVREHRFIMQQFLGRDLTIDEEVHHKNGIKDDNRIENLELVVKKMHFGIVKCPHCQNEFKVK